MQVSMKAQWPIASLILDQNIKKTLIIDKCIISPLCLLIMPKESLFCRLLKITTLSVLIKLKRCFFLERSRERNEKTEKELQPFPPKLL